MDSSPGSKSAYVNVWQHSRIQTPVRSTGCPTWTAMAMSTEVLIRERRMLIDRSDLAVKAESPFLHVRPGHFVIVGGDQLDQGDWWMGQVIFCEGSVRRPRLPSLVQVADVDTGAITWINADAISDVIWSMDGLSLIHISEPTRPY